MAIVTLLSQSVLDVLVNDLGIAHTVSKHNRDASFSGSQHTYAWRVHGRESKPYWYPNTAHHKEPCIISLHFPNLIMYREYRPQEVHASQRLKVGLYTPTILGRNSHLSWFYDRWAIKDPAHTGTSKGLSQAINRGPIRKFLPKNANVYVTIQSHGLSAGVRPHYVNANGVRNELQRIQPSISSWYLVCWLAHLLSPCQKPALAGHLHQWPPMNSLYLDIVWYI